MDSKTRDLQVNRLTGSRSDDERHEGTDLAAEGEFSIFSANRIGESNKRQIIQMLFDLGPTSRADLARHLGTKRTTITGIVQPMIDIGLLAEIAEGTEKRGVGKPARPLWFSPKAPPVCSVVLKPDRIETALITLSGDIIEKRSVQIRAGRRARSDYVDPLVKGIADILDLSHTPILGIGVAVGGMIDPDHGSIVAMNLAPSLAGLGLKDLLEDQFHIRTEVDHHPRAILLGERWFGAGRGLKNFAIIYADEVLGSSLYLNGKPFRGPHGSGGELGHTIVDFGGEICTCGKRGCWETIATLPWLRARAAEIGLPASGDLDVEGLIDLAATSAPADTLLRRYAHNLAIGISNLQTLLMPDNFIIYGSARRGRAQLQRILRDELTQLAAAVEDNPIRVLMGRDEQQITLQGAAGLVISQQLAINY